MKKKPAMPRKYTVKFMNMVWEAFLPRQKPVSTKANPACMNITRKPAISVQTKLVAMMSLPPDSQNRP